jgi:hypothetical protein
VPTNQTLTIHFLFCLGSKVVKCLYSQESLVEKTPFFHHWSGVPNAYGKIAFTYREIYPTLDPDIIFIRGKIEVLKNNKV